MDVATIAAPADRGADVRRATRALTEELTRCGASGARWGSVPDEGDARVQCSARALSARALEAAPWARAELVCQVRWRGQGRQITTRAQRALASREGEAFAPSARQAETGALLEAARQAGCPIVEALRELAQAPEPTHERGADGTKKAP